jgi:hypothetical protein
MTESKLDQIVQLRNGDKVKLRLAIDLWDQLQTMILMPNWHQQMIELQARALDGSGFQAELREEMKNMGFADGTGRVTPEARAVVLSALMGEDMAVHVVSPFVNSSHRRLAEFVNSVNTVKGDLLPDVATRLLTEVIGEDWIRRIQKHPPDRGGFSRN